MKYWIVNITKSAFKIIQVWRISEMFAWGETQIFIPTLVGNECDL